MTAFDYEQYKKDSEESKLNPLARYLLPGFSQFGIEIEVFILPGFENNPKRYILSLSGVSRAVKRQEISILRFLNSRAFKRKHSKGFESYTFYVEGSNKPISGIPGYVAVAYWHQQDRDGNELAESIVDVLLSTQVDDLVSMAVGTVRTVDEQIQNLVNTWEFYRESCRTGHSTIKKLLVCYEQIVNKRSGDKKQFNDAVKVADERLELYHCHVVELLTGLKPTHIYETLVKEGVKKCDRERLRDWYSKELLVAIDKYQKHVLSRIQKDASLDLVSVACELPTPKELIPWRNAAR